MKRMGVIILTVALISNLGLASAQHMSGHEQEGRHHQMKATLIVEEGKGSKFSIELPK